MFFFIFFFQRKRKSTRTLFLAPFKNRSNDGAYRSRKPLWYFSRLRSTTTGVSRARASENRRRRVLSHTKIDRNQQKCYILYHPPTPPKKNVSIVKCLCCRFFGNIRVFAVHECKVHRSAGCSRLSRPQIVDIFEIGKLRLTVKDLVWEIKTSNFHQSYSICILKNVFFEDIPKKVEQQIDVWISKNWIFNLYKKCLPERLNDFSGIK